MPLDLQHTKDFTVGTLIQDGKWVNLEAVAQNYPHIYHEICQIDIAEQDEDEVVWQGSSNGVISIKLAYEFYRAKSARIQWHKRLWTPFIPPKINILAWSMLNNRISISDNLYVRKCLRKKLCMCWIVGLEETLDHIMLHCTTANSMWRWLSELLNVNFLSFNSKLELLKWVMK